MRLQFSCRHGLLTATPRHGLLRAKPCAIQWQVRRLSDAVSSESNLVQVYVSRTLNPHINLAIEHRLLQASHPNSTVLFLYTNGPCVVIGRNQNPWLEVNLGLLNRGLPHPSVSRDRDGRQRHDDVDQYQPVVPVQLIRRYSGGGTVFHDEGNVNYSVICPPARFDRDRHAKMVVRALTSLVGSGLGVRVNERHDIVMNGGDHSTPQEGSFKISGSAYKITRTRALHHGTCLLSSPYLHNIGPLLHSPASPYIRARGTESVRSRIRNVFAGGFDNTKFEDAVVGEFRDMYGPPSDTSGSSAVGALTVGAEQLEDPKVLEIYEELMSPMWTYGQTPQFTFSTKPTAEDGRPRPAPPEGVPSSLDVSLTVRKGRILEANLSRLGSSGTDVKEPICDQLVDRYLHQIRDWGQVLGSLNSNITSTSATISWLNSLFGLRAP